jgi:hypothetical protein
MKKVLAVTLMAISSMAFAKDVTKVPFGSVSIEDSKVEVKNTQGKSVVVPVDESYMSVSVNGQYQNQAKDKSFVLFSQSSGGTACPAIYFVYEMDAAGNGKRSKDFGTCSDIPKVTQKDNSLILVMPELNGKKKVTYKYENGVVTENGKPVK